MKKFKVAGALLLAALMASAVTATAASSTETWTVTTAGDAIDDYDDDDIVFLMPDTSSLKKGTKVTLDWDERKDITYRVCEYWTAVTVEDLEDNNYDRTLVMVPRRKTSADEGDIIMINYKYDAIYYGTEYDGAEIESSRKGSSSKVIYTSPSGKKDSGKLTQSQDVYIDFR